MKFLLWALVIYLAWRWYSAKNSARKSATVSADAPAPSASHDAAEKMVVCAQCGIHLPVSEAVQGAGSLHYCSEAHRLIHSTD